MKVRNGLVAAGVLTFAAGAALGQSGTLDVEVEYPPPAPYQTAWFNGDATSLTWQQQVRCTLDGQLEGVSLYLDGVGSQLEVAIGLGDAWSTNIQWSDTVTVNVSQNWQFIDVTSANIVLSAGDTFVIQTHGTGTGTGIYGSYLAPPAEPQYEEPLWLNQQNFADGNWRHALRSYMLEGPGDCLDLANTGYVGGQPVTWTVSGGTPGFKAVVVYGFNAGTLNLNNYQASGREWCATIDIAGVNPSKVVGNPKVLDANGEAAWTKTMPLNQVGNTILTQAVGSDTCPDDCQSAVDSTTVQ